MPVLVRGAGGAAQAGIPASIGFAATAGDNTLHLRPQTGGHNCKIDWGDGTVTRAPVDGGNVIHNYAAAGTYNIQIKGKSFAGFYVNMQTGREKYVAAYSMGQWAVDTMIYCTYSFFGCINLATIDSGLFRYNTHITHFNSCFSACEKLEAIPYGLFMYNSLAIQFNECFRQCKRINTTPPELFRYNTLATDFRMCFYNCPSLAVVQADLFRYNIAAVCFAECFNSDVMLTTIPADLFRYNTAVTYFEECFTNCTKLTLRADIFGTDYANRFNGKKVDFTHCFHRESFSGTQGSAPALWNFTGLTATKTRCFGGSAGNNTTSLSNYNSIPNEWKT